MKMTRILMTAMAAAMISAPAFAADDAATAPAAATTAPTSMKADGMKDSHWAALDTNGDGKISKDEWTAAADKKFAELDTNNDGYISKEEFSAKHTAMKGKHKHGGSTAQPPANNEATSTPPPSTPAGADGAGGATAQ